MDSQHQKYKIQKGDTIASVALKLDRNEYDLKSYHNTYCELSNLIELDFPKNMKELFLPALEKEIALREKENQPKKVQLGINGKLALLPVGTNKNYGVLITLEKGEDIQTIKYEVNLRWVKQETNGDTVFEINRISKTYINDEEPDSIADTLAVKIAQVLYPLQVIIDKKGDYVGINNFDAIQNRWAGIKEAIYNEYEGEWVEKYIQLNDEALKSKELIEESLTNDYFIRAYFNGIYQEYPEKGIINNNIHFPVFHDASDVTYKVNQQIEEYYDESNLIVLNQKGELNEERAKEDLEERLSFPYYAFSAENYTIAEGKYRSKYFLNPNSHVIEYLFLEVGIELDIPEKITITASNLAIISNIELQNQYSEILGENETNKSAQKSNFLID